MQGTLSETEMQALLSSQVFGHLGCTDGCKPYVVPMAYVYHKDVIYGQTIEGKKVEMLRNNPLVCFQVEHMEDRTWRSVICWGTFQEMDFRELHNPESVAVVELLTKRIGNIQENIGIAVPFSFAAGSAPGKANEKLSTLFRIVVTEKTGRFFVTGK